MPDLRDLLTLRQQHLFDRAAPENRDRFSIWAFNEMNTRHRFKSYAEKVAWRPVEVTKIRQGPTGPCLVTWIDSYPIVMFTTSAKRSGDKFYSGYISGHCSMGGDQILKTLASALYFAAGNPDGRRDSDCRYLRKGGKSSFFEFCNATDPQKTTTLAKMLAGQSLH